MNKVCLVLFAALFCDRARRCLQTRGCQSTARALFATVSDDLEALLSIFCGPSGSDNGYLSLAVFLSYEKKKSEGGRTKRDGWEIQVTGSLYSNYCVCTFSLITSCLARKNCSDASFLGTHAEPCIVPLS